jgi:hypothetical protein
MKISRTPWTLLSCLAIAGLSLLGASSAHAELEACGGIFLRGDERCEYRPKEECMTQCQTVAVEQSCVAKVYNECETSCTSTASTSCESSCTSSCVNDCTTTTTTEQPPSCMDLCLSDCEGDDDSACGNSRYRNACGRCTAHNCEKKCEAKCGDAEAQPKITTVTQCMPTCTSACSASCTAKANNTCQVACQEKTYTECEQKMVEQCQTECKDKGGAIFCDGQFVNAGNARSCADELRAKIKINVDIKATAETVGEKIDDTADKVGDKIDEGCSVGLVGSDRERGAFAGLIPLVAALAFSRIRRRRR